MDNINNFSSTIDLEVDSDAVHLGTPQEVTEASPHAAKHELAGWGVRAQICSDPLTKRRIGQHNT